MELMSRMPDRAMCMVRGMGVALRVRVSTCCWRWRSVSLCFTPKRCSSSIINRPKSLNSRFFCNNLWVPISRSMRPCLARSIISLACLGLRNRLNTSMFTGKPRNRLMAVA